MPKSTKGIIIDIKRAGIIDTTHTKLIPSIISLLLFIYCFFIFFKLNTAAILNIIIPITIIELTKKLIFLLLLLTEIATDIKIKVIIFTGYIPAKK